MNNTFNNYEFPEERNNFSVVINVVTCFVCGSLGLITFLKLLRMYNYDELYKEGYLQLSLLIFIAAMLAVFFIVRKFDIDFEKPTAAILLLMSSAIIIFSVILFFNASMVSQCRSKIFIVSSPSPDPNMIYAYRLIILFL